ncbi:MAG: DUF1922 domain-containing protein [Promethearchaeota archaeon]
MEINRFKIDENPYIIFKCFKCHQYIYVKTSQKTKKCLRCGHCHKVKDLINSGEIIKGLTNAIATVKEKQNNLAVEEFNREPDLRTMNDFCFPRNISPPTKIKKNLKEKENENGYSENFKQLLFELSKRYEKFPSYMISMLIDEFKIPFSELHILMNKFKRQGFLIPLKNNYYKISKN